VLAAGPVDRWRDQGLPWCERQGRGATVGRSHRGGRHANAPAPQRCDPGRSADGRGGEMSAAAPAAGPRGGVVGGGAGIGLETARLARGAGAEIILTARNPDRLHRAGLELNASIAAFDALDFDRLRRFFDELLTPVDHVLVTGPGPYYAPLADFDFDEGRRD